MELLILERKSMSSMVTNRNKVTDYQQTIFALVKQKNDPSKHLNLGCGMKFTEGFTNVDKYVSHPSIVNYDMFKLPYPDNSIELIYSSHSLEHLPIRHAKMALEEWHRVLNRNGKLVLLVPDLNAIMTKLLDDEYLSDSDYDWYQYTLFGYQIDTEIFDSRLDHAVDPGQFHTCGFSKNKLKTILERLGFDIKQLFSYDGWRTPSIFVEASKLQ